MITLQRRGIVDEYRQFSFSRASMAFDSRGRLYHPHNARFEPGKFGQAVLIEEGTTNLVPNGNGELGDTWWLVERGNRFHWNADLLAFENKPNAPVYSYQTRSPNIPVTPGKSYTYSLYMKGNAWAMYVRFFDANNMQLSEQRLNLYPFDNQQNDYFRLFSLTAIAPENASYAVLYFDTYQRYNLLRYIQFEEKPYTTSYIHGTRAAETLTVPRAGVLDAEEGTIEFWWKPLHRYDYNSGSNKTFRIIFAGELTNSNYLQIGQYTGGTALTFLFGDGVGSYKAVPFSFSDLGGMAVYDNWHYVCARWSRTQNVIKLRFDDKEKSTTYPAAVPPLTNDVYIGHQNGIQQGDCLIDHLRISNIARSDEEIAATYASGQPLQADQYTTLILNFDGPDMVRAAKTVVI